MLRRIGYFFIALVTIFLYGSFLGLYDADHKVIKTHQRGMLYREWSVGAENSNFSSLKCMDVTDSRTTYRNRTCYAKNVCIIDGSFVFFSNDPEVEVPNPLTALNVNFWWESRGGTDYSGPFYFKRANSEVPKDVPRVSDSTYYFVTKLDFDFHFGHVFMDGLFAAYRAYELFGIDKIPGSELKIASADHVHCWNGRKGCERNWAKVLAITDQKDLEIFGSSLCFPHLLVGAGMGSFMTIENDKTIQKLRGFILERLALQPFDDEYPLLKNICVRPTRKPPMCGRIILNFDEMFGAITNAFKHMKVTLVEDAFNMSLKDEIAALRDCSVLVSQEGGAGAVNMMLPPKSALITIDFIYLDDESKSYDGAFYDRLTWIKHLRYQHKKEEIFTNFRPELRNDAPQYGNCQDFRINVGRMVDLVKQGVNHVLEHGEKQKKETFKL